MLSTLIGGINIADKYLGIDNNALTDSVQVNDVNTSKSIRCSAGICFLRKGFL
jgi:hypothetical protein